MRTSRRGATDRPCHLVSVEKTCGQLSTLAAHWDRAGHAYAEEHDRHYAVIHDVTRWFTQLFLERGAAADARRARAFPLIAEDQTRVPDHVFAGPDLPCDDTVRQRFWGEDAPN